MMVLTYAANLYGVKAVHGAKELLLSDRYDVRIAHNIVGKCNVHSFRNYTKLENVGPEDYCCRFKYKTATGAFVPAMVPMYCKCEMPFNPDEFMSQSNNKQERYIYGMLAFALLELGRYTDAEEAANKGFEIDSEDAWTHHALCHVYQYNCRFKEAVQFMEKCSRTWSSLSSFMYTHNWWHVALCYLEGHSPMEKVRDVYDQNIWKELERSDASPAEVYLNAVGLLLRVYVRGGINVFGDRLKILADCLTNKAFWYLEWHLDVLVVWALSCTGKVSKAEELLEGLKSRISKMTKKKRQHMQRAILLAEALFEYGKGENERALEFLDETFDAINYKIIGASDEQLDVFNEVWITMLLNSGQATKAIQAIEKQLKKREGTPFLWRLLEKSYPMSRKQEAIDAGKKAQALEAAYFD